MTSYLYALSISLATVPIPFIGLKLFFPFALLLALVSTQTYDVYKIINTLAVALLLSICAFIYKDDPVKILIIVYCALSISFLLFDFDVHEKHWLSVAYLLIVFFILSILSIQFLGYDIIAKIIYGESRHEIGAFELISFRGSGVYQEPSTYAYHLIAIVCLLHLANSKDFFLQKCIILIFALLSFSAAAAVALLMLAYLLIYAPIRFNLKLSLLLLLSPAIVYLGYIVVTFLQYKVGHYATTGFDEVTRFQAISLFSATTPILGLTAEQLNNLVIFDMGPLISSVLIFGLLAIPVVFVLLFCCIKNPPSFCLLLTKIPLTDPLLWCVVNRIFKQNKANNL
ncbi:hypothetical protein [Pseudoalteromonas piratica]|uniref:Uncharacterized protein n=1 Tax=Pseudoalteromonas piratica TaxID=1348114 RepID=A0A0A7EJX6_9GAMM|nr:hypothetical protein [Pseudoalteromonas piratica]AIY66939.1 hypothetical protein OM33_17790 [Pseudoalteromonas piratica]